MVLARSKYNDTNKSKQGGQTNTTCMKMK